MRTLKSHGLPMLDLYHSHSSFSGYSAIKPKAEYSTIVLLTGILPNLIRVSTAPPSELS